MAEIIVGEKVLNKLKEAGTIANAAFKLNNENPIKVKIEKNLK